VKKVVIIVLVVVMIGVLGLLLLTSGGGRGTAEDKPSVITWIGSLAPRKDVRAADLAGSACFDAASEEFVVPSGSCQIRLPADADRITLCLAAGVPQQVRIKGRDYGPQDADLGKLGCDAGESFSLYDTGSILIITALPVGGGCRLRLLPGE
jgi:hypothetical protein